MSTEANKQRISELIDAVWNQHNESAIDLYFGPGLREEVAEHYHQLLAGFPDLLRRFPPHVPRAAPVPSVPARTGGAARRGNSVRVVPLGGVTAATSSITALAPEAGTAARGPVKPPVPSGVWARRVALASGT
jgi:hypothetical protein